MLTQEDLKNIGELIDIKLTFFENRIEAKMNARFDAIEARLDSIAAWADKTSKIVKVAL